MKKWFALAFVLIFVAGAFAAQKVLYVELVVGKDDQVLLKELSIKEGRPSIKARPGAYSVELWDSDDAVLGSTSIEVSFSFAYHGVDGHIFVERNSSVVSARFPYMDGAKYFVFKHRNKVLLKEELNPYICDDNGVCDNYENSVSCPADCPTGGSDGYCDHVEDNRCDPDCAPQADPDCEGGKPIITEPACDTIGNGICDAECEDVDPDCIEEVEPDNSLLIVLGIVFIAIIAFLIYMKFTKKEEGGEEYE
jgi:hypothetical protein